VTPTITLVGLKGASFENLNSESHNYLENLMLLSEPMKIVSKQLALYFIYYLNIQVRVADLMISAC